MKKTLLALAVFGSASLYAQTTFQLSLGSPSPSVGYNIIQNADSTYMVLGTTNGGPNANIYLVKTNATGTVLWSQTYGGNFSDVANNMQQTADGGYIVCGSTNSFGQGAYVDGFLMKLDAAGSITWAKTYGGSYGDYLQSVVQTPDGGYLTAGHTAYLSSSILDDIYLVRTNSIGDTLWTKAYNLTGGEACNSICATADGGYMLTGTTSNNTMNDAFLMKIDSVGIVQWAKSYGGPNIENSGSVQQTADHGYIFGGATMSFGAGSSDGLIIKCDSVGNVQWSKTYGNTNDEGFSNITQVAGGGYAMTGYSASLSPNACFLLRTNANGDSLWMRTYSDGNSSRGNWIIATHDHGFAIAGILSSPTYGFMFMVKSDSLGHTHNCNEFTRSFIRTTPVLTVSNLSATVAHGGAVGTPAVTTATFESVSTLCLTTDVAAWEQKQNFNFYPNPFNTSTQIAIEQTGELSIYNVLGEMVLSIPVNAPSVTIDKGMLQNGMYIWVMKSEGKILSTGKLIAQ